MKITEVIIAPKESKDTTSCGTTYSGQPEASAQDIVPHNTVPENNLALEVDSIEEHPDHSAIAEGVSQILRRAKKGTVKQGFRCSTGPRKGRIVAKPSTCFSKLNPVKGARIRAKRRAKAGIAGKKMAQTKRSGAGSLRLKGAQIKKRSGKGKSVAKKISGRAPVRSKIVRAKK